jgi:uncharacterized protein (DUF169 family)
MTPTRIAELLELPVPPVAISFRPNPPAGVAHVGASQPASCGYWKLAQEGQVFFTEANDHVRCPVGAHTHGVPLTPEQGKELEGLIGTMVHLQYLDPAEVPNIPHRPKQPQFGVVLYAPLGKEPVPADVVMVRGNAHQLMLLAEAAQKAGVAGSGPAMGRPTCAVMPQAMQSNKTAASFGCVGNRVYTGAGENDAWFAIPGEALAKVEATLGTILNANRELEKFHKARATT